MARVSSVVYLCNAGIWPEAGEKSAAGRKSRAGVMIEVSTGGGVTDVVSAVCKSGKLTRGSGPKESVDAER